MANAQTVDLAGFGLLALPDARVVILVPLLDLVLGTMLASVRSAILRSLFFVWQRFTSVHEIVLPIPFASTCVRARSSARTTC